MNTSIYLQLISLNKTYNNHFLKRYVKLVSFFKERNYSKQFGVHEHHIIPESFGGLDTKENLVFITIREHFILHWMLYKAFPKSGMVNAFHIMCHCSGQKVSSKVYEKLLLEFIERQRENVNKLVAEGSHHFLDKEKARARANKRTIDGKNPFSDKEKAKQRVIDGKNPFSGGELQRKNNLKRVANGEHNFLKNNIIKILCEHCKRTFDEGNYNQWHGDKCKLNPLKETSNSKPKIECPYCNRYFYKSNFLQFHGDKCKLKPNN